MQRLAVVNDGETSPLISDIALEVKTSAQESKLNLEHKNTSNTNVILIQLNHLSERSRDLQAAEAMLESKITPSFFRHFRISTYCAILMCCIVSDLALILSFDFGSIKTDPETYKNFNIITGLIGGAILTLSLIVGYRAYKRDIHHNRNNGIIDDVFETTTPLSLTEATGIQKTLATIEYEKGNISTKATGSDMRSASKFLADARSDIDAKISYINLKKNSLFKVLSNFIPVGDVQAVVLEYAIDPENDYRSEKNALTFGGV